MKAVLLNKNGKVTVRKKIINREREREREREKEKERERERERERKRERRFESMSDSLFGKQK